MIEGISLTVELSGQDGNAFSILGRCQKVMRQAGISKEAQAIFMEEAKAGDYDHLIQTVMKYFEVE